MSLSIRHASDADSPEIVRVIRAVFDEYGFTWEEGGYHADLYSIESTYFASGDIFYVAELDGRVSGTAALELSNDPIPGLVDTIVDDEGVLRVAGTDCALNRLYVDPGARRGGVGSALMQRVLDDARGKGCSRLEIWSDKRFADAHRLYQRFGASVIGDRICDDPDVSPEWGLSLPL